MKYRKSELSTLLYVHPYFESVISLEIVLVSFNELNYFDRTKTHSTRNPSALHIVVLLEVDPVITLQSFVVGFSQSPLPRLGSGILLRLGDDLFGPARLLRWLRGHVVSILYSLFIFINHYIQTKKKLLRTWSLGVWDDSLDNVRCGDT